MSHEIRTPLNGIIGVIELLRKSSLNTEQQELIDMASSAASSLLSIISDILDFSKIEARRVELECHPFDLHALIEEVARLFRQLSQERHLGFNVSVDQQLPHWVNGDRNRVRQILFNYLNNALKFTETGHISLNASTADGDYILLEVIDTGIGISAHKQQLLFEDFSQADKSTTRKYGGTGLGLAICKKLAQLMNGKVGVVSETGKGSRFWVRLQLPTAIAENERKDGTEFSLKGMQVLLVEDNKINQMVARKQLEKYDAKVSIAENGEEAIEEALTGNFDVLLMDCQMPVKDGFAATLELRQSGYRKPIIALTANATTDDRQRCLDAGMNDYLSKPFKSETLYALLLEWYDSPSV
jgi:CheY-like chemotaxis protein